MITKLKWNEKESVKINDTPMNEFKLQITLEAHSIGSPMTVDIIHKNKKRRTLHRKFFNEEIMLDIFNVAINCLNQSTSMMYQIFKFCFEEPTEYLEINNPGKTLPFLKISSPFGKELTGTFIPSLI